MAHPDTIERSIEIRGEQAVTTIKERKLAKPVTILVADKELWKEYFQRGGKFPQEVKDHIYTDVIISKRDGEEKIKVRNVKAEVNRNGVITKNEEGDDPVEREKTFYINPKSENFTGVFAKGKPRADKWWKNNILGLNMDTKTRFEDSVGLYFNLKYVYNLRDSTLRPGADMRDLGGLAKLIPEYIIQLEHHLRNFEDYSVLAGLCVLQAEKRIPVLVAELRGSVFPYTSTQWEPIGVAVIMQKRQPGNTYSFRRRANMMRISIRKLLQAGRVNAVTWSKLWDCAFFYQDRGEGTNLGFLNIKEIRWSKAIQETYHDYGEWKMKNTIKKYCGHLGLREVFQEDAYPFSR